MVTRSSLSLCPWCPQVRPGLGFRLTLVVSQGKGLSLLVRLESTSQGGE